MANKLNSQQNSTSNASQEITKKSHETKIKKFFLEFKKAFETIIRSILLHKREHYGIRGLCLK